MILFSKIDSMQKSAKLCPSGVNIKLLIRHSIRSDIPQGSVGNDVQLTPEGRIIAEQLGESLNMKIGIFASSPIPRCIETCKLIISGYNKSHNKNTFSIATSKMLQASHVENDQLADATWKKLNFEGIFAGFVANTDMPGIYDLKTSSNRLLEYLFKTGNANNTLDIYCTHDFQLSMLFLYFSGNTKIVKEKLFSKDSGDWPSMLEGMFLWKDKNQYFAAWRGEIKKIEFEL